MYFLLKIEFFPASHVKYRECSNWILAGIYFFCSWKGIFPSAPNTFSGAIWTRKKTCPNYTLRRVTRSTRFFPPKNPQASEAWLRFSKDCCAKSQSKTSYPSGTGRVSSGIPRTYHKLKESNWLLEFKPEFFRKVLSPRIFSFFSPGSQRCDREIFWFDSFLTLNPGV